MSSPPTDTTALTVRGCRAATSIAIPAPLEKPATTTRPRSARCCPTRRAMTATANASSAGPRAPSRPSSKAGPSLSGQRQGYHRPRGWLSPIRWRRRTIPRAAATRGRPPPAAPDPTAARAVRADSGAAPRPPRGSATGFRPGLMERIGGFLQIADGAGGAVPPDRWHARRYVSVVDGLDGRADLLQLSCGGPAPSASASFGGAYRSSRSAGVSRFFSRAFSPLRPSGPPASREDGLCPLTFFPSRAPGQVVGVIQVANAHPLVAGRR